MKYIPWGLHPQWNVDHYAELYKKIKHLYPHIHVKSLTAVEIKHIANRSGISVLETLRLLKNQDLIQFQVAVQKYLLILLEIEFVEVKKTPLNI